jgi:AcrR family transcriptional regulator
VGRTTGRSGLSHAGAACPRFGGAKNRPELVLGAAVVLVDREDLDGLSMRKLAAALGVEAMTLHHLAEVGTAAALAKSDL